MKHPITPPPELVEQWSDIKPMEDAVIQNWVKIATAAAQWGADQELEACCEWLRSQHHSDTWPNRIRAARRPKPPSLKEQALKRLKALEKLAEACGHAPDDTIRRALEQLND
jgi:hypothetical protein